MPRLYEENTARKNNSLNIIRLLLAVTVILSHSYPVIFVDNRYEPVMRLTRGQDTLGTLAVNAFFAISGFLILQSWVHSRTVSDYLKKRVLRIYPGYLVTVLICTFVVGPLAATRPQDYLKEVMAHGKRWLLDTLTLNYLHLPQVFAHHTINNSIWTIRYEFLCYLLVAALGMLAVTRKPRLFLLIFLLDFVANALQEAYAARHGMNADTFAGYAHGRELLVIGRLDFLPRFLVYFLAGGVCYLYRERIPRSPALLTASLLLIVLTAADGFGLNLILPLCGTYVLLYVCFLPQSFGKFITDRGDFSYGIYLYAFPVQQLLYLWFPVFFHSPLRLFVAATLLTVPLAFLSWHLVEKPALALKPRPASTGD